MKDKRCKNCKHFAAYDIRMKYGTQDLMGWCNDRERSVYIGGYPCKKFDKKKRLFFRL